MDESDRLVTITISIGRNGDIHEDTQCHGNGFSDVYRGMHAVRDRVDELIAERRRCPENPLNKPELTLQGFGWAPGGYTVKCVDCPPDIDFMENGTAAKRAWRCEKHAQQRLDEAKRESAPAAGAPKTTVDGEVS